MDYLEKQARLDVLLAHERELFELLFLVQSPILRAGYIWDLQETRKKITILQRELID